MVNLLKLLLIALAVVVFSSCAPSVTAKGSVIVRASPDEVMNAVAFIIPRLENTRRHGLHITSMSSTSIVVKGEDPTVEEVRALNQLGQAIAPPADPITRALSRFSTSMLPRSGKYQARILILPASDGSGTVVSVTADSNLAAWFAEGLTDELAQYFQN